MIRKRPSSERGHANHGWLETFHSFSFAHYHDPAHMGFRSLRVINDDVVQPAQGFGTHGHRDMEIVTYVVEGALEHRDSMGTGSVLRPGDVQRMSAGRGVTHSEFNHSKEDALRLLQIWILPATAGIEPEYEERHFPAEEKRGRLRLLSSPDGEDGSLRIHQDARIYASILSAGESLRHEVEDGRHVWIQIVSGALEVNGIELGRGDGAAISGEPPLDIAAASEVEFLLFDVA